MAPLPSVLFLASISFSGLSRALTINSVPSPPDNVGSWKYLGCANEITDGRALNGASTSGNMTIEVCTAFCKKQDYGLAGLEYSRECFCGNQLAPNSSLGAAGCDMVCSGNRQQICGGSNRLTLYQDTEYAPTTILPRAGTYNFVACMTEGKTERALSGYSFTDASMTVPMCVSVCDGYGYPLAGVEYASECYCAYSLSNQSFAAPASECDMKCAGSVKTFCGGSNRLLLYRGEYN